MNLKKRAPYIELIAAALLLANLSHATIIYSGVKNISIPITFDGIFLDIDTGATSTSDSLANWDLNLFFGGEGIGSNLSLKPVKTGSGNLDPIINQTAGTTIDLNSEFYGGDFSGSSTHIGSDINQFESGAKGYFGFQFTPNGTMNTWFGWMHTTLDNTGGTGIIHDWAWEDSGAAIQVDAIPEPAVLSLMITFSTLGLILRKVFRR